MNQMQVISKRNEKLQKEIIGEGNDKGRLKDLWKLRRQGKLSNSYLRERGIAIEGNLVRGTWGGVSMESKERNIEVLKIDVIIKTNKVENTLKGVVEQFEPIDPIEGQCINKLVDIFVHVN